MPNHYDWQDVEIARSQAETHKKRAKAKRDKAKTAPHAKPHSRITAMGPDGKPREGAKVVYAFHANTHEYLLKAAAKNDAMALKLRKKADKIAAILTAADQRGGAA